MGAIMGLYNRKNGKIKRSNLKRGNRRNKGIGAGRISKSANNRAALPCGNYNGSQCPQGTHRAMRQPDGSCTCVSLSSFPENTRGPKPRPIRKGNIRRGGTLPGKKTIG